MVPPLQIDVAETAVRHSVMVDRVPALLAEAENMRNRYKETDYNDDEQLKRTREGRAELPLESASAWLGYYRATGNKEEALKSFASWRAVPVTSTWGKFRRDVIEARLAEWEGRKLDALILYRRAAARVRQDTRSEATFARNRAEALLVELGGGSELLLAELEKSGGRRLRWPKRAIGRRSPIGSCRGSRPRT
jgi:hypothetical protein